MSRALTVVLVSALFVACAKGATDGTPAHCQPKAVQEAVESFVSAFNSGKQGALDATIAREPKFEWYSVSSPQGSQRMDDESRDRATLLEYFSQRHELHERLSPTSFSSKYESRRNIANFEFRIRRAADDVKVEERRGKGAYDCETRSIMVWSM